MVEYNGTLLAVNNLQLTVEEEKPMAFQNNNIFKDIPRYDSMFMQQHLSLADPHFWGMNRIVRMAQILNDWSLTRGAHSNNHFGITLTVFAYVAAAPGKPTALDTHWIWQDGQNLCENTPQIKEGYLEVPKSSGLGIKLNMEKVMAVNALYNKMDNHDRDDAMAMQYLISDWRFDSKKPVLVR